VAKLSGKFFQREAYLEDYEMVIKEQLALASFLLTANTSLVMIWFCVMEYISFRRRFLIIAMVLPRVWLDSNPWNRSIQLIDQ
jgi:hypothetical protein